MKLTIFLSTFLFYFILPSTLCSITPVDKYYAKREWDKNKFNWKYKNELSETKIKKQINYYKISYNNNGKIIAVRFPYYKRQSNGNTLRGFSLEQYDKDERLIKRENYVKGKRLAYFLFKYTKKGLLKKEEYYIERDIEYYRNKKLIQEHQVKLKYYLVYYYKGTTLVKRACYSGDNNKAIGNWLYYNKNGKIIKQDKYTINDSLKSILTLRTLFYYHRNGELKSEKNYVDGKPFGFWYSYDKDKKLIREEFYNDFLVYYYKFYYHKNNELKKSLFYQDNKIKEILHYHKQKLKKKEIYHYTNNKIYIEVNIYNKEGKIIKESLKEKS